MNRRAFVIGVAATAGAVLLKADASEESFSDVGWILGPDEEQVLRFAKGSVATLTASSTDSEGIVLVVLGRAEDRKDKPVLGPVKMDVLFTWFQDDGVNRVPASFLFYDWNIPRSLPTGRYRALFFDSKDYAKKQAGGSVIARIYFIDVTEP